MTLTTPLKKRCSLPRKQGVPRRTRWPQHPNKQPRCSQSALISSKVKQVRILVDSGTSVCVTQKSTPVSLVSLSDDGTHVIFVMMGASLFMGPFDAERLAMINRPYQSESSWPIILSTGTLLSSLTGISVDRQTLISLRTKRLILLILSSLQPTTREMDANFRVLISVCTRNASSDFGARCSSQA